MMGDWNTTKGPFLSRPVYIFLAILVLVTVHVSLRMVHIDQFRSIDQHHPVFNGSDSFYHVHRTERIIDDFPRTHFFDPLMAYPNGATAEWSIGFDFFWAALVSLGKVVGLEKGMAVQSLPFTAIMVSMLACYLFSLLIQRYCKPVSVWFATFCFSTNLAFTSVSSVGDFDHHVFETLGVVLLMLAPQVQSEEGSRPKAILLALALVVAIWCSTLFAYLAAMFFFLWLAVYWANRLDINTKNFVPFALFFIFGIVTISIIESRGHGAYLSFRTLSLAHAVAMIVPLVALLFVNRLSKVFVGASISISLLFLLIFYSDAVLNILTYVAAWDDFIVNMGESRPIFMTRAGFAFSHIHLYFGVLYLSFPILFIYLRRKRKSIPGESGPLSITLWFSLAMLLLSFSQKRFSHLAVPGFLLMLFLFPETQTLKKRVLSTILIFLLCIEPFLYFGEAGLPCPSKYGLLAAEIARHIEPKSSHSKGGIATPPNMGNALIYFSRRGVSSNSFFYPKYLKTDMKLRQFYSNEQLVSFLRKNKMDYLIAADDVRYRTMLLGLFGLKSQATDASLHHYQPCNAYYLRYAYDRLACEQKSVDGLNLIASFVISRDPTALMRRVALYKVGFP